MIENVTLKVSAVYFWFPSPKFLSTHLALGSRKTGMLILWPWIGFYQYRVKVENQRVGKIESGYLF